MQFSANVSTLFQDLPFLERLKMAKECGFEYVEMQHPYEYEPADLAKDVNSSKVKCLMMNTYSEPGQYGYAAVPGKAEEYYKSMSKILRYYNVLNLQKIHITSGLRKPEKYSEEEQFKTLVWSLDTTTDLFDDYCFTGLIEPICPQVVENYFLNSYDTAVKAMEATTNKNIKLLLDIYHLHMITGDVKKNLEKYYPYAGHIQISQDPGRVEPFNPNGKIDYDFVFDFLTRQNYKGFIGLEYYSSGSTPKDFEWMKKYM